MRVHGSDADSVARYSKALMCSVRRGRVFWICTKSTLCERKVTHVKSVLEWWIEASRTNRVLGVNGNKPALAHNCDGTAGFSLD
jgi:hypothetical protein